MPDRDMKIAVIGAGLMGHGIVQVFASKGYSVTMLDVSQDYLDNGMKMIRDGRFGFARLLKSGKMTPDQVNEAVSHITPTTEYSALKECNLVIEAVPENLKLKSEIFKKLDALLDEDAIIASNTSGILISSLAANTNRGPNFIGMHWFNPPQVMKLIEVVRGPETSEATVETLMKLSTDAGKTPILVNDGPGFFTTRYINSWLMEAIRMFESGVSGISEIDQMSKLAFGFPMGPFELSDFIGLDTMFHIAEYMFEETKRPDYAPPVILKKLVLAGYLGVKKGSKGGFYEYFKIPRPEKVR